MDGFVVERFFEKNGLFVVAGVLPAADIHVVFIVSGSFAVGGLVFLAEVSATRFVAVQSVDSHHFGDDQEVFEAEGFFKLGVQVVGFAYDAEVSVEFFLCNRS